MKRINCFVNEDRSECPQCKSTWITGGALTVESSGTVVQDCSCDECGYRWTDVFRYSHSTADRLPSDEASDIRARVFELSQWPTSLLPRISDPEKIVPLESFSSGGELCTAAFEVNGLGYSIDFVNHSVSRNTAYDREEL